MRDAVVTGQANIIDLIKRFSSDPRAATGGEYPAYPASSIVPDFRDPVFTVKPGGLQPGEITAPIIRPEAAYRLYILERHAKPAPGVPERLTPLSPP
jgi:hypothetical protein